MTSVGAVILHPRMSVMAGGESVAVHIIKSLVKSGYEVSLVSDRMLIQSTKELSLRVTSNGLWKSLASR